MNTLLEVRDLNVVYGHGRKANHVLRDVSISIEPGETLGLVGESGSGKTTLGRMILGLARASSGSVCFEGEDITNLSRRQRRALARDVQVVFQDPYSSLDPSMRVKDILIEPLVAQGASKRQATDNVDELLTRVGMPVDALERYPREFSGGQRQRIAIARALALSPKLIVCDEPVSALDLSTQRRVLDLFIELQERTGLAYLFISHDLAVIRYVSHRVAVMRQGEIVELGSTAVVTERPVHEYTQRLLAARLVADPDVQRLTRAQRLARFATSPVNARSADERTSPGIHRPDAPDLTSPTCF